MRKRYRELRDIEESFLRPRHPLRRLMLRLRQERMESWKKR
jgi:hypothetical protein